MTDLAFHNPTTPARITDAIAAHLGNPNPNTAATYSSAMRAFAAFIGVDDPVRAGITLLSMSHGQANLCALQYRAAMVGQDLSVSTINLRLRALQAASKLARFIGAVDWALDVKGIAGGKPDMRGPLPETVSKMIRVIPDNTKQGRRDRAILGLLYHLGLRRGSIAALELSDFDVVAGTVAVKLKGRHTDRKVKTIPKPTLELLQAWLEVRGAAPGPLFIRLDRAAIGLQPITGHGIWALTKVAGHRIGIDTHPHALRHTAITKAADRSNGNIVKIAAFSDHQDWNTVQIYVDNVVDAQGELSRLVASEDED